MNKNSYSFREHNLDTIDLPKNDPGSGGPRDPFGTMKASPILNQAPDRTQSASGPRQTRRKVDFKSALRQCSH